MYVRMSSSIQVLVDQCPPSPINHHLFLPPQDHPTKLHVIKVQGQGIANLAWSPDDSHILVCGPDDERHVHIYNSEVRT